jgi:glycosyltransferase involved in cell wall biosynthesis
MKPNSVSPFAILADSLARWTGGVDFLRFCINALNSVSSDTTWTVLVPSGEARRPAVLTIKSRAKWLLGKKVGPVVNIFGDELKDALSATGAKIEFVTFYNTSAGLEDAMSRCGAETVFPCTHSLGHRFMLSWVGYIPDLQHKRLPEWFSARDRWMRDRIFSKLLREAAAVVVNSSDVAQDIDNYYPGHRARLFVLPFSPPARRMQFPDEIITRVQKNYALPPKYFIISNQFWVHKSHETAFLALRKLRNLGHDVHIVCTGNTHDYRWPDHFTNLKKLIQRNNLQDSIHMLGILPKAEQLAVMYKSIAVIQPTLFEGGPGGGAVYDAISINIPSIVSDIRVNREIDIGVVRFFTAGSVDDLAERMAEMLSQPPEMPSDEENFARLCKRQQQCGGVLLDLSRMSAYGAISCRK